MEGGIQQILVEGIARFEMNQLEELFAAQGVYALPPHGFDA